VYALVATRVEPASPYQAGVGLCPVETQCAHGASFDVFVADFFLVGWAVADGSRVPAAYLIQSCRRSITSAVQFVSGLFLQATSAGEGPMARRTDPPDRYALT
jgi:hypothetical protein